MILLGFVLKKVNSEKYMHTTNMTKEHVKFSSKYNLKSLFSFITALKAADTGAIVCKVENDTSEISQTDVALTIDSE